MLAMVTGRRSWALPFVCAALAACASQATPLPDAERHLTNAEALVRNGAMAEAQSVLERIAGDACPKRLRDRRDVARATALVGLGEPWNAFLVLEKFPDLHPHSELRPTVVEMVWEIGKTLAASDGGFLFFWSDRVASRTVLEHLITRHPDTPRLADALRLLGDMAYEDRNFVLAQDRFRQLMKERPDSEWVKYARFRFAMSLFESLQGPEYDLDKMGHAARELRDFLAETTENPDLVTKARAALALLMDWQAKRHLQIAAFYRRVGNRPGRRYHLEIAASRDFENSSFHTEALSELAEFRSEDPGAAPPGR
ncbi:MAG: outer membrane protein assembly factor BamD [Planctomycetes bacterium]|nr:outer membrane protein assembly factor BamD [Planctomycetota bacterium]